MDNINQVIEVLQELRLSAKVIVTETDLKETMRKYDMLFVGEKFNTIYACELRNSLEKVFNHHISMTELLEMIPKVCSMLGMRIVPMTLVDDPERKLSDYQITLF